MFFARICLGGNASTALLVSMVGHVIRPHNRRWRHRASATASFRFVAQAFAFALNSYPSPEMVENTPLRDVLCNHARPLFALLFVIADITATTYYGWCSRRTSQPRPWA
jgi:hypothetical protein